MSDAGAGRVRAILMEETQTVPRRLSAMWMLHVTAKLSEAELTGLMSSPVEELRGWAVRLACEGRAPVGGGGGADGRVGGEGRVAAGLPVRWRRGRSG